MSIEAIRLRNFRGFSEAKIDLKPLTVLLGPNSAGKSAFGHALAAMAHAQREFGGGNRATLTPKNAKASSEWPVDLGLLADLRTAGTSDRPFVDLLTSDGWVTFGFGAPNFMEGDLRLTYLNYPRTASESATKVSSGKTLPSSKQGQESSTGPTIITAGSTRESRGTELVRKNEVIWEDRTDPDNPVETQVGLDGLLPQTLRNTVTRTEMAIPVPAINEVRSLLTALTYLRGTRARPSRCYDRRPATEPTRVGYSGEFAASTLLEDDGSSPVEHMWPPRFPGSEAFEWSPGDVWEKKSNQLERAVGLWLEKLGLATRTMARESQRYPGSIEAQVMLGEGDSSRDITEVGYGISQIVPVIIAGLLQSKGGLFVVDLPETHLHPRPQGPLADFFCSLALSGRQVLVETHSEIFFHRLRLRAAMDNSLKDLIGVYFIDQPTGSQCSDPRLVGLSQEDELNWPEGFFQDAFETELQIRRIRMEKQAGSR